MPKVRASFHFDVEGLDVEHELLGAEASIVRDEYPIRLMIPGSSDAFSYGHADAPVALGGFVRQTDGHVLRASVVMVRTTVELDLPVGGGQVDAGDRTVITQSLALLKAAADEARCVVRDYVHLARVRHQQAWLGRSGLQPTVTWLTDVRDATTRERVRLGYHDPIVTHLHSSSSIDRVSHRAMIAAISADTSPTLPEALVADAKYLAWFALPPQRREAVLLAAIACEISIRDGLRRVCPADAQELLEFAIARQRDVSVAAVSLFDKAAESVVGRSLRVENKERYNAITKLFEDRNDVAHRGQTPSAADVKSDLDAADYAIEWVASLDAARDG